MNRKDKLNEIINDKQFAIISMLQHFELLNEIKDELCDETFNDLFDVVYAYLDNEVTKMLNEDL